MSSNLVRAFSSFKMAVGETPGQGCAEILHESWSILSRDTWWNGIFGGCFQRLAVLFFFLQSETVIQTKRRHFIVFAWRNSNELLEPLCQSWPGVSLTAILNAEKALGTRLKLILSSNPRTGKDFQKTSTSYSTVFIVVFFSSNESWNNKRKDSVGATFLFVCLFVCFVVVVVVVSFVLQMFSVISIVISKIDNSTHGAVKRKKRNVTFSQASFAVPLASCELFGNFNKCLLVADIGRFVILIWLQSDTINNGQRMGLGVKRSVF